MRLRLLAPRYWLTWIGLGLLRLLAFLPFGALVRVGRGLGTVLRYVLLGFARTARRNLCGRRWHVDGAPSCSPRISPPWRWPVMHSSR